MTKDEALKLALEAMLKWSWPLNSQELEAITALRQALEQPEQELTGRQLQRMKQQAWKKIRAEDKDDPELCFALGFDAGYDAVARRVEPPEMESGGGFESRPASLEQPEQEPVAWMQADQAELYVKEFKDEVRGYTIPLYTAPPKREWVGLTDDEVNEFAAGCHLGNSVQGAIYKAQAKLKEKNT